MRLSACVHHPEHRGSVQTIRRRGPGAGNRCRAAEGGRACSANPVSPHSGAEAPRETPRTDIGFVLAQPKDELAEPAHFTVLKITPRDQGSELSSATMIPQWPW